MDQLTKNELQPLDIDTLRQQAEVIRDAVLAKTISARQVGELFCGLVTACGDINTAVRVFLSVNVPESVLSCSSATIRRSKSPPTALSPLCAPVPLRSTPWRLPTLRFINLFALRWCPRVCVLRLPVRCASTAKAISA